MTLAKPSSLPTPRPPETTIAASERSGRPLFSTDTRFTTLVALAAALTSTETSTRVAEPPDCTGAIELVRTVITGVPFETVE